MNRVRRSIRRKWFEIVGTGDARHLRAGARHIGPVRSDKGVIYYLSLYQWTQTDLETGRCWGIWGRGIATLYQGEKIEVEITDEEAYQSTAHQRQCEARPLPAVQVR